MSIKASRQRKTKHYTKCEEKLDRRCETLLRHILEKSAIQAKFVGPTVGIEQEFFVFKAETGKSASMPASLEDTQRLLRTLTHNPRWRVFTSIREVAANRPLITRLSSERGSNRYTVIKYEFPPHMLEVAFTYFSDLHELDREIQQVWADLEEAATQCGLRVLLQPFINPPALSLEAQSAIDPKLLLLGESRRAFYIRRNEPVDLVAVDFPSYMTSTQTQVAVPYWWRDDRFMHRLYALEIMLIPLLNDKPEVWRVRQRLYHSVFRSLPLLGVPDWTSWSLLEWARSICDSPLLERPDATIRMLSDGYTGEELESMIKNVRDLQLIRPKRFGALEFRGDASVTEAGAIIRVAAIRFAASILASAFIEPLPNEERSFSEIRSSWIEKYQESASESHWTDSEVQQAKAIQKLLVKMLTVRGKGEEIFLDSALYQSSSGEPEHE